MVVQIEVGKQSLEVIVGGPRDGAPVLLLHGFPENGQMWDAVTARLQANGRRTAAPNQRGYSASARPAEPDAYRLPELIADAAGLLDALRWRTVDVVGHDWGAVVAWGLAANHPERVRTLTAISVPHPAAYSWALQNDPEQRELSRYVALFQVAGKAEEVLLADDARRLREMFRPLPPDEVEVFIRPLLEPGALTAALNWYRAMTPSDLAGVGPVGVPTTYLWGSDDLGVSRAAAEKCGEWVAEPFRFVELAGVSHWAPEQAPQIVAAEILTRIRD